jgi:hypothetical protein
MIGKRVLLLKESVRSDSAQLWVAPQHLSEHGFPAMGASHEQKREGKVIYSYSVENIMRVYRKLAWFTHLPSECMFVSICLD